MNHIIHGPFMVIDGHSCFWTRTRGQNGQNGAALTSRTVFLASVEFIYFINISIVGCR